MTDHNPIDVHLYEVGPRDGLQNESRQLEVAQRVHLVETLVEAGARDVEIGSFVHPSWIPQLAGTEDVSRRLNRKPGVRYWALVPNVRGLERAVDAGVSHIAVFVSASEAHNQKNLNRSIAQSLEDIAAIMQVGKSASLEIRAYISMVFGCPMQGAVDFGEVLHLGEQLLGMGAFQISLGDTTGVGTPGQVREGCREAVQRFGSERVALHLHDTQGLGLVNSLMALQEGVRHFDSAVGGLGGCPYAPGAAGNLGSEDLVNMLEGLGLESGIHLEALCQTSRWLERDAGLRINSRFYGYWKAHQTA